MNSISVKGEEYVKASSIARELGYTADYVGQLCRSGKVDAELVGRSWYVKPGSIQSHKKSRYRNTAVKSKSAIQKALKLEVENDQAGEEVQVALRKPSHFYNKIKSSVTQYSDDTSDLLPQVPVVKKREVVEVVHADAQDLPIETVGAHYEITTTERPIVVFKGELSISDIEEKEAAMEAKIAVPDKSKKILKRNGAISMKRTAVKKSAPVLEVTKTVDIQVPELPTLQAVIPAQSEMVIIEKTHYVYTTIIVSSLVALTLALGFLGLEQTSTLTESGLEIRYDFNFATVFDALI